MTDLTTLLAECAALEELAGKADKLPWEYGQRRLYPDGAKWTHNVPNNHEFARAAANAIPRLTAAIRALVEERGRHEMRDARLERVILVTIEALRSLSDDALGHGHSGGATWPLRDELIDGLIMASPRPANMRQAVDALDPARTAGAET